MGALAAMGQTAASPTGTSTAGSTTNSGSILPALFSGSSGVQPTQTTATTAPLTQIAAPTPLLSTTGSNGSAISPLALAYANLAP
jgi:hypothetical protein